MKQLGVRFLNTVEMSSQEAAWYLLRQPMSRSSHEVSYIPTVWPQERHKLRKRKAVMDEENLDENSTDIWTKSMIQRYEERPSELEDKWLADFVAWYTPVTKKGQPLVTEVNDDASGDDEPAPDNVPYESTSTIGSACRKRSAPRVIRYRGYELNDVVNYKREIITLYLPFKNEAVEILDRNGFLRMYDKREAEIMTKRKEFESNIDIAKILDELKKI
ncbi:helitron_like_N domain-containing protein [Trichonephila clavipes]|uniref:Helitron_like_N domain-containing protein n=1 Tax=Trichonephila clavipes TaxID=2585209 RepID=A0A8X6VBV9_TRICX|nr:helitron_like_N domain-containing protein [Trichonephila clavipes]